MVTPQQIEDWLRAKLDCPHLTITGDGAHFEAVIVCADFAGKSRVARHQVVYGALGSHMHSDIHALSMQTFTPGEWAAVATH